MTNKTDKIMTNVFIEVIDYTSSGGKIEEGTVLYDKHGDRIGKHLRYDRATDSPLLTNTKYVSFPYSEVGMFVKITIPCKELIKFAAEKDKEVANG